MTILGIDPGTTRVGYGVIRKNGLGLSFVSAGILSVSDKKNSGEALFEIKKELDKVIKKFKPEAVAVEKLFFAQNQKTAIKVAEARGVIILSAAEAGLEIKEFSPNEMKSAITGHGFADKRAVLKMVKLILKEPGLKVIDDASDALALAILAATIQNSSRKQALDRNIG